MSELETKRFKKSLQSYSGTQNIIWRSETLLQTTNTSTMFSIIKCFLAPTRTGTAMISRCVSQHCPSVEDHRRSLINCAWNAGCQTADNSGNWVVCMSLRSENDDGSPSRSPLGPSCSSGDSGPALVLILESPRSSGPVRQVWDAPWPSCFCWHCPHLHRSIRQAFGRR